jgi:3-hydroxyisobutyrate dehydrogenase-like beta-hydroxyacid dehydrogenase
MVKDMGIACELARAEGVPIALASLGRELWERASHDAPPGASISELVRWVEKMTGVEIASRRS